jgi:PhnB protein
MAARVNPVPDGYSAVTPYLIVGGAAGALEFYRRAFGAVETYRLEQPDGRIGHAEMRLGGSVIMLADEHPEMGARGPRSFGGSPVSLMLYVDDVDAVVARAVELGAQINRPIEDRFYGDRSGGIEDPYGHVWFVATHVEDVPPDELERRAQQAAKA